MELIEAIKYIAIFIGVSAVLYVIFSLFHVFDKLDNFQKEERTLLEKRKQTIEQTIYDAKREAHELWNDIKH